MTEYYFSTLSALGKHFYRQLLSAIASRKPCASSSPSLTQEEFRAVVNAVNYDHPELFYVNFQSQSFSHDFRGFTLQLRYLYPNTLVEVVRQKIDSQANSIAKALSVYKTKPAHVQYRIIHNQLLQLIKYDFSAIANSSSHIEAYTIAGAINSHHAVCEGIAKAFKYICDRVGLFCIFVAGKSTFAQAGQIVDHAWNIVELDDGYAHIDVTWDINASTQCRHNRYDYFCISDEDARVDHTYNDTLPCNSMTHSYFASNNAIISGFSNLESFLSAKMAAHKEILYFKLKRSNKLTKAIVPRITESVQKVAAKYYTNGYSLSAVFNEEQYIFFYRIVGL